MSDWQPIETAPKGREILVYSTAEHGDDPRIWTAEVGKDGRCFSLPVLQDEYYMERLEPTHWMPLPEPPEPNENAKTHENTGSEC